MKIKSSIRSILAVASLLLFALAAGAPDATGGVGMMLVRILQTITF